VNEHPSLALGDRPGYAFRVSDRRGGVEEVSDHGQEGAYDARYSADPEDPSFFTPGGSYLHTLFNAHIDTLLLPTLPSSPAIMIP
jgi:hypothetical protein